MVARLGTLDTPTEAETRQPQTSELAPAAFVASLASDGEPVDPARVGLVASLLDGTPLGAHAEALVSIADDTGIDWRLLPVIAMLETGGGLATVCGHNAWGWGGCAREFESFEAGALVVATGLSLPPYAGLPAHELLCTFVSGHGCTTNHAVDYVHRAAPYYQALGGTLVLPAYPEGLVEASGESGPGPIDEPTPTGDNAPPADAPGATLTPSPTAEADTTPVPPTEEPSSGP